MRRNRLASVLGALLILVAVPSDKAIADTRAGSGDGWRDLLARSAASAKERTYQGETVWVVHTPDGPRSVVVEVRGGGGRLHVGAGERLTLRLGDLGGDLVHHEQGWFAPLPAADHGDVGATLDALERKYRVESLPATERVVERPCQRLDFYRRSDGSLAERLWLDVATALPLRRETFDADGVRLRFATYRSLDLAPGDRRSRDDAPGEGAALEHRAHDVKPVGDRGLDALHKAGYAVPSRLPGGYERSGVYASTGSGAALQTVYGDGLYTVSVFQQRGRPDWSRLPPGARTADIVDWEAYEWPAAVPYRLVWEASGTTYFLIGDAPPDDMAALAGALPRPSPQRPLDRIRRGLSRLWSAMSPWE